MKNKEISIYIHIPFCEKKCDYCAFASFVSDEKRMEEYVDSLVREIEDFETESVVKTIYLGGGTPSLLNIQLLEKIFEALKKFKIKKDAEITIELNPNSIQKEKLSAYKKLGITRLSIGIQSLNDEVLKKIGRLHNRETALKTLSLAKEYFDNISCDLILGVEKESYKYLPILKKYGATHISTYMLEVYENTPLFHKIKNGDILPLSEEEVAFSYEKIVETAKKLGFSQYEISNFALKGYESQHNINYWTYGDYVGFGLSAHSFLNGKRSANANDFHNYFNRRKVFDNNNQKTEIEERIFLGLRCKFGVDTSKLKELGYIIEQNENYSKFIADKIIFLRKGRLFLNKKYYLVSDFIIFHLLP